MPKGVYKHKPKTEEWKKVVSKKLSGEKSPFWKGNKVGYTALHDWVRKYLGKPIKCSNAECKYPKKNSSRKTLKFPKRFEWANIDHQYQRKKEDYISLCVSCHRNYDIKNNNYRKYGTN